MLDNDVAENEKTLQLETRGTRPKISDRVRLACWAPTWIQETDDRIVWTRVSIMNNQWESRLCDADIYDLTPHDERRILRWLVSGIKAQAIMARPSDARH